MKNLKALILLPLILVTTFIAGIIFFVWFPHTVAHNIASLEHSILDNLSSTGNLIQPLLLTDDLETVRYELRTIHHHHKEWADFKLFDADGTILYPQRPETSFIEGKVRFLAHHLMQDGERIATMQVGYDFRHVYETTRHNAYELVFTVLGSLITMVVALFLLLHYTVFVPVNRLSVAAAAMAKGSYDVQLSTKRKDEVGRLITIFSHMAKVVQETHVKLAETAKQAEQANVAKSEFLANMSHELRTPMNGVLGMVEMLGTTSLMPKQQELTDLIKKSAENLLVIVNDILDFSKIEAQSLEMESIPYSIQEVVQGAISLVRPAAEKKGVELRTNVAETCPEWMMGDPARVHQIVLNLLSNAVKFTSKGHVAVRVLPFTEQGKEPVLMVAVADTGIGIPEDKFGYIFNKFTQTDASMSRKFGGTGLGLAIISKLLTMMGAQFNLKVLWGRGLHLLSACPFIYPRQKI